MLIKGNKPRHICVHLGFQPSPQQLRIAVTSLADASYVYTTTKSKPEGRTIERADFVLTDDHGLITS